MISTLNINKVAGVTWVDLRPSLCIISNSLTHPQEFLGQSLKCSNYRCRRQATGNFTQHPQQEDYHIFCVWKIV